MGNRTLNSLADLRRKQMDEAARELGQRQARAMQAAQQLQQLEQYLHDYRLGLQHRSLQQGMPAASWQNYQRFMAMLERAIAEQRAAVERVERLVQAGRQEWQEQRRQAKSIDTLLERRARQVAQREARREQRLTDEFVTQRMATPRSSASSWAQHRLNSPATPELS